MRNNIVMIFLVFSVIGVIWLDFMINDLRDDIDTLMATKAACLEEHEGLNNLDETW